MDALTLARNLKDRLDTTSSDPKWLNEEVSKIIDKLEEGPGAVSVQDAMADAHREIAVTAAITGLSSGMLQTLMNPNMTRDARLKYAAGIAHWANIIGNTSASLQIRRLEALATETTADDEDMAEEAEENTTADNAG